MDQPLISITKSQSLRLKGIAILMMLFYHLFNRLSLLGQCDSILYINNVPFVHWLSKAANPVWLYLFLSGYGYAVKQKTLKEVGNSILNIYQHWWVILIIAFPLGFLLNPEKFRIVHFFSNLTAWNPTYNTELWFLLPFVLLILSHKLVLYLNKSLGNILYTILVFLVYSLCLLVFFVYGEEKVMHISRSLWLLLMVFYMFVPFSFGVLAVRIHHLKFSSLSKVSNPILLIVLSIIIIVQCYLSGTALGVLYQIPYFLCFILICSKITISNSSGKILERLGKYSLSMWFIHSFICYHIFSEYLYSLKYPVIIFIVLLCASYYIAILVEKILGFFRSRLA